MAGKSAEFWKNSMNYGAIVGASLIILSLVFYFFDITNQFASTVLNYAVVIAGIIFGTKNLRDKLEGGRISYARALGAGTTVSLFASIILGFYMFVFMKFIDPDFQDKILAMMEEKMYADGTPEELIERSLEMTKKFMTPTIMMVSTFFGFTFWGFLFSLITSIFLKKKSDNFDDAMTEIN